MKAAIAIAILPFILRCKDYCNCNGRVNCNGYFAIYIAFSIVIEGAIGNASAIVRREYLKDTNIELC